MIVPQNRLIVLVAVVAVPFSAAASIGGAGATLAALLLALLFLLCVLDAVLALDLLKGVSVHVPAVTRLAKNNPGTIELLVSSESRSYPALRVGLPMPPQVPSEQEDLTIALPTTGTRFRVEWPCLPARRGRYAIRECFIGCASLLGLWERRARLPVEAELRVYPDLRGERRYVSALFLRRGLAGVQMHRQVGKGREFEKLREYAPGDSYEDIHWKATAKRLRPMTKLFRIERTQEVYALVDASRLSARVAPERGGAITEPSPATLLDRFMGAALSLKLAAEQQGDLFGLLTFTSRIEASLRAGRGKPHMNACRDALYMLEPKLESPDYGDLFSFVRRTIRKRSLLVILTSLDDPALAEQFVESVRLISRQHLVLVVMMKPGGADPLFKEDVEDLEGIYRHLSGHMTWQKLREVEKDLSRLGVRLIQAEHEKICPALVTEYLNIKQKQAI